MLIQYSMYQGHQQAQRVLRELLRTRNAAAQHAPDDMEPTACSTSQTSACAACGTQVAPPALR